MAQVLVVEDCEDVVQLLCHAIEAAGHEAICVGAQIAAHAALDLRSFDLVICDIRLPDGSGEDIVLKALSMGIRIALMTGYPDEAIQRFTPVRYLQKPVDLSAVARLLNDELESRPLKQAGMQKNKTVH